MMSVDFHHMDFQDQKESPLVCGSRTDDLVLCEECFNVFPPDQAGAITILSAVSFLMGSGLDLTALGSEQVKKIQEILWEKSPKLVFSGFPLTPQITCAL